jgi:predicted metalloprotease
MNRERALILFLVILITTTFLGCNVKKNSLTEGQQKAVENGIEFIRNSKFDSKDRIDTSIIKIKNATSDTWDSVFSGTSRVNENAVDSTDWIITIGNTRGHDFAIIVCDSTTYKVIGFIPIA